MRIKKTTLLLTEWFHKEFFIETLLLADFIMRPQAKVKSAHEATNYPK